MLTRPFYLFTGLHSFLIGLFPFYIPVYLYSSGLPLSDICFFVAATGAGYCLTLYVLDRLRQRLAFSWIISCSFISEFVLLAVLLQEMDQLYLPLVGLGNGIFSCTFWSVQRLLFVSSVSLGNSGRNFGNTQLMVLLVMKAAVLLGGLLLEQGRQTVLLLCSGAVIVPAIALFVTRPMPTAVIEEIVSAPPLSIKSILSFRDTLHSRSAFCVDGVFLYLESYFWLISLFMVVEEDFRSLGLLTVMLALLLGAVFVVIKNTIDRYPDKRLYALSVFLYALSWLLRAVLSETDDPMSMVWMLAVIAFCTSLFRLSFNKRFFDNAKLSAACHYILLKSYISQFSLMAVFLVTAALFTNSLLPRQQLTGMYVVAALLAPVFLLYGSRKEVGYEGGTYGLSSGPQPDHYGRPRPETTDCLQLCEKGGNR